MSFFLPLSFDFVKNNISLLLLNTSSRYNCLNLACKGFVNFSWESLPGITGESILIAKKHKWSLINRIRVTRLTSCEVITILRIFFDINQNPYYIIPAVLFIWWRSCIIITWCCRTDDVSRLHLSMSDGKFSCNVS